MDTTNRTDITLYEIAGQDWDAYACEKKGHYNLTITNDDEDEEIRFENMHPFALESLSRTCLKIHRTIERLKIGE